MKTSDLNANGRSDAYNARVASLRKRAATIPTQENLNAILMLIRKQEDREAIFEIMWPYLKNSEWTCPDGAPQNFVGN